MDLELNKRRQELLENNLNFLGEQYQLHQKYCVDFLSKKSYCIASEAEDHFSEAILVLRKNIINQQLKDLSNLRNYLLTICINKVRDSKKKTNRRGHFESKVRQLFYDQNYHQDIIQSTDSSMSEICRNALRRLGHRCAELLKLFYYEEMSLKDIAALMNFSSTDSVKSTKSVCFKKWVNEANLLRQKLM